MISDRDLNEVLNALIEKCKAGDVSAIRVLLDFNQKCKKEVDMAAAVNLVISDDYGEE